MTQYPGLRAVLEGRSYIISYIMLHDKREYDDIWYISSYIYFDHSTCEEKVSISSTRLNYENFTFRVLDLSIKISHFEYSKVDLVSGRSKLQPWSESMICDSNQYGNLGQDSYVSKLSIWVQVFSF